MVKNRTITLKIREDLYQKLKNLDIKRIDCFEVGAEKLLSNYEQELEIYIDQAIPQYGMHTYQSILNSRKIH